MNLSTVKRDLFRSALLHLFDGGDYADIVHEDSDNRTSARAAIVAAWNCDDIMPGELFEIAHDIVADDVASRTYGAVARALHRYYGPHVA